MSATITPALAALIAAHDEALAKYLATDEVVGAEGGGPAYKAATDGWCAARDAALAFPSHTLADLLAKIALKRRASPDDFPRLMDSECPWLLADIERLAEGTP